MSRINKLNSFLEEIKELSIKYRDYTPYPANNIPYRDPSTPEEITKAKEVVNKSTLILACCSIVFIATFIISLVYTDKLWFKLLLLIMAIYLVGLTLKWKFEEVQIFTGTVVYKQSVGYRQKAEGVSYKISVIPENGEKVIYGGIYISQKEYRMVSEGTRVLVINKGHKAVIF